MQLSVCSGTFACGSRARMDFACLTWGYVAGVAANGHLVSGNGAQVHLEMQRVTSYRENLLLLLSLFAPSPPISLLSSSFPSSMFRRFRQTKRVVTATIGWTIVAPRMLALPNHFRMVLYSQSDVMQTIYDVDIALMYGDELSGATWLSQGKFTESLHPWSGL